MNLVQACLSGKSGRESSFHYDRGHATLSRACFSAGKAREWSLPDYGVPVKQV